MIHWRLTSAQYEAALFAIDRDRLPYPTWNSRRVVDEADLYRQRQEAIDTLIPRVDDEFARLFGTLADPQVRVHVHGFTGPELGTELRAYAGIGNDVAGVVVQQPDLEPGVSGDVTATLCGLSEVTEVLIDALPREGGGTLDKVIALKSELDSEPTDWDGWKRPMSMRDRVDRMFNRPRSGWGEVLCFRGSFLDNRIDGMLGFAWVDFYGDGRYFVNNDPTYIKALPMPRDRFLTTVDSFVRRVREGEGEHIRIG